MTILRSAALWLYLLVALPVGAAPLTIRVTNPIDTTKWYVRELGFHESIVHDSHRILLSRGALRLIMIPANQPSSPQRIKFAISAQSLSPTVHALRTEGAVVNVVARGDTRSAQFEDPEGNNVEAIARAPLAGTAPVQELDWLEDSLLDWLEAKSLHVRLQRGLPIDRMPEISRSAANAESAFNRHMLRRVAKLHAKELTHEQLLELGILREAFIAGESAEQDYWLQFSIAPYQSAIIFSEVHEAVAAAPLNDPPHRERYLELVEEYARLVRSIADKTIAQATRGVRIPRVAIDAVRATIAGQRDYSAELIENVEPRIQATPAAASATFRAAVKQRVDTDVLPAYDRILSVLDDAYQTAAPAITGFDQYPGGRAYYLRRIRVETGRDLAPRQIHQLGLDRIAELEAEATAIRTKVGFSGDRAAFHAMLHNDARFLANSPADVEQRYTAHVARIAARLPDFFRVLPHTPYGVERLAPGEEAGLTYGYYQASSSAQARGLFRYNGSNLAQRSLVTSAHIIYHELMPGHHLRLSLGAENHDRHPVFEFLSSSAYEEGWAEYAVSLAQEMGGLDDPYDRYGHLLMQEVLVDRLVVDTGMNAFGWPIERARDYMQDHSFESVSQIASETLRYSTDIPAQALAYRLGYEAFINGRQRAQQALKERFNIAAFNTAVSNHGALPLTVLDQQIDWFIAEFGQ